MDLRDQYKHALEQAWERPAAGPDALGSFLTLNAAYFLGPWLPPEHYRTLVDAAMERLDGLADLELPADAVRAAQLAQHAREIVAEMGASPWLENIVFGTDFLLPAREDWEAGTRSAALAMAYGEDDGSSLLLAHARRRLWELGHPAEEPVASPLPQPLAEEIVRLANGGGIQLAEAAAAEASAAPDLAPALLAGLRAASSRRME